MGHPEANSTLLQQHLSVSAECFVSFNQKHNQQNETFQSTSYKKFNLLLNARSCCYDPFGVVNESGASMIAIDTN